MMFFALLAVAFAIRLIPHAPNLAAVTAVGMLLATMYRPRYALFGVFGLRFVSDWMLGFPSPQLMVAIYATHAFGVLAGMWIGSAQSFGGKWFRIISGSLGCSTLFFLATNFAFLYPASEYPHTWHGILVSYIAGLPFARGTFFSDLGCACTLFTALEVCRRTRIARWLPAKPYASPEMA